MPKVHFCLRALVCALLLTVAGSAGLAQDLAEAKAWVEQYAKYFHYESKFSAEDKTRLAELRVKVHSPATSLEDRQAALTDFAKLLFRAAGTTPAQLLRTIVSVRAARLPETRIVEPNSPMARANG